MLVLTRKLDEKVVIGNEIIITILKIQGDKVSIGIKAKKDTPIYRYELLQKENFNHKEEESQSSKPILSTKDTE